MSSVIHPPSQADTEALLEFIRNSDQPVVPDKAFLLQTLPELLNRHMGKAYISTDTLFELIGMNRSTGYRILGGQRRPSRDVLIALSLALGLDYQEAQNLLKVGRVAQLTPRNRRDFLILFAVMHGHGLGDTDDLLIQQGHKALLSGE